MTLAIDTHRTETPYHPADGHGNSIEPTGGHEWSITGQRWEKLGAGYSEFRK